VSPGVASLFGVGLALVGALLTWSMDEVVGVSMMVGLV
jgi:hypothetical protein